MHQNIIEDFQRIVDEYSDGKFESSRQAADIALIMLALKEYDGIPPGYLPDTRPPSTFEDFSALIECDLGDAERDTSWAKQSREESYKQIAKQRAGHAAFFLEKAKALARDGGQREQLQEWKTRIRKLES